MLRKLFVGIGVNNFKKSGNDLNGCVNDIDWMARIHEKNGFFVVKLIDQEASTAKVSELIKKSVMEKGIQKVNIHVSLHGSQVQSTDPYEPDRLDELICCWDYEDYWNDPFIDNKLAGLLKNKLPEIELNVSMDCCHSRTNTRSISKGMSARYIPPPEEMQPELVMKINRFGVKQVDYGPISPTMNHVLFSACKANQTAADAYINGKYNGAFTWAMCTALERMNPKVTKRELFKELKMNVTGARFSQIPGLEGSVSLIDKSYLL